MSFGLSIINNLTAIDAQRHLNLNNFNLSASISRLSSGLRINTAADDAAGLALSERLRSRIKTLEQGLINSQDATSVIQIAEGSLQQITVILQRLKTLATEASSAARSDADRQLIQTEVSQLLLEITRISSTTKFGDQPLLDGSIAGPKPAAASQLAIDTNTFLGASGVSLVVTLGVAQASLLSPLSNATCFLDEVFRISIVQGSSSSAITILAFSSATVGGDNAVIASLGINFGASAGTLVPITITSSATGAATFVATLNFSGLTISDIAGMIGQSAFVHTRAYEPSITVDRSISIQVGANVGEVIKVFSPSVSSSILFSQQNLQMLSPLQAEGALSQIDHALDQINFNRSTLGATANRVNNVGQNGQVFRQNLIASESRIRDLDVAQETTNLTRNQILVQTAQAMLAQANLLPQSLLQLFR